MGISRVVHALIIMVILVLIMLSTPHTHSTPIVSHLNYDEIEAERPDFILIWDLISRHTTFIGLGLWSNASDYLELVKRIPLPEDVRYRLDALLNYTERILEDLKRIEGDLSEARDLAEEAFLEQLKEKLRVIYSMLYNVTMLYYKLELLSKELSRTYRIPKYKIDEGLDPIKDRIDLYWKEYKKLLSTYEQKRIVGIATIITISLNKTEVYPLEPVEAVGTLMDINGTPLVNRKIYVEMRIHDEKYTFSTITTHNGSYSLVIRPPLRVGSFRVYAYFKPEDSKYLPSISRHIILRVLPLPTEIRIISYTERALPQERVIIDGYVLSPELYGESIEGVVVLYVHGITLKARAIEGRFRLQFRVPYYMTSGKMRVKLTFKPKEKLFSPTSHELKVEIIPPPYKLTLEELSVPKLVFAGTPLIVECTPRAAMKSNLTMKLTLSGEDLILRRVVSIFTNSTVSLKMELPLEMPSGIYKLTILIVPSEEELRYLRMNIYILVLNPLIVTLIILLLGSSTLIVLKLVRGRRVKAPVEIGVPERITSRLRLRRVSRLDLQRELARVERELERLSVRGALRALERLLARVLNLEIKPGHTHREICLSILNKVRRIGVLLLRITLIFEAVYYGGKKLNLYIINMFRRICRAIISEIRRESR